MKRITVEVMLSTSSTRTLSLPAKYEICDRCRGEGKHVNPAIDEHGISPDEFRDDPDFEEGYFSGRYDVRCEEGCDDGKLLIVDYDRLPKRLAERVERSEIEREQDRRDSEAETAAESHRTR